MRRKQFRQIRMEQLFLLLYIPLVLAMMLVMPVGGPPDEHAHLRQVWLLSSGQVGTGESVFPANLREILRDSVEGTEASALKDEAFRNVRLSQETVTEEGDEATGIYPLASYLPQSIMMFLTRLFTDRIDFLLYSARIGSLIVTGFLFWLAIRRSPAGKVILLAIACLPLTLQEAASASCDGMTIAGISWITAELLRRMNNHTEYTARSLWRYVWMGLCAVLCKLLYVPVLLLGLMPKAETTEDKKQKRKQNLVMAGALLAALAVWYLLSVKSLSGREGMTSGALNRAGQVAANPLILIGAQVRTLIHRTPGWIRQLFGVFGRLDVFSPWLLTGALAVSFCGIVLADSGAEAVLPDRKKAVKLRLLLIGIFILCWMILSGALLVWWTGEESTLIQGIQGRYFLPCLFCLLLALPRIPDKAGKGGTNRREIVLKAALAVYVICTVITIILLGMKL
ncbi:MAG: DUF2142 domain-containing protein [Clostridia bacterium]|nr:DUF2142 domain-containing protein [Clostridia bacterium]